MIMLAAALLLPTAVVPLWDLAAKSAADDALPASSEALVAQINADNQGWTAAVPTEPMTRGMLRRMCGTELSDDFPDFFKPMPEEDILPSHSLADSLDARTKWPECLAVIGHVRNQGPCGCCWAFGATQSLQDRFCIHKPGHNTTADLLSVEDVLACMDQQIGTPGQGCDGGDPKNAWYYLANRGVVSGGDYHETDGRTCLPYRVPPSATSTSSSSAIVEGGGTPNPVPTPKCPGSATDCSDCHCIDAYRKSAHTWRADKRRSGSPYFCKGSGAGRADCLRTVLQNGPIEASMIVHGDIWSYKSGVYTCKGKGGGGSGHSVVIIGYGIEPHQDESGTPTPYWLVKNSWGAGWGMGGFFKVTRTGAGGVTNDCGIEAAAKMAMPA